MPAGEAKRITPRQEQAIVALLTRPTIEQAAEEVGVNESTVRRWLKEPAFEEAYREERRRVLERAVGVLQKASVGAVGALMRNLKCGLPSVEVRAARTILEMALKGQEIYDHDERLRRLEEADETGW